MKKTCYLIFILLSILTFCLFFSSCDESISSEISEHFEDISHDVENSPSEEISQDDSLPSEEDPFLRQVDEFIPPLPAETIHVEEDTPEEHLDSDPPSTDSSPEALPPASSLSDPSSESPSSTSQSEIYSYTPPESETSTYLAACATTALHVRKGPSTDYASLFLLRGGDSLPYLWSEGKWHAVWTGSRVGYIHGDYAYLTSTSIAIEEVIRAGLDKLGTPYEWGAPRLLTATGEINPYFTGDSFDCSSFVQYCYYIGAGIKLGNYTGSQADYTVGEKITSYADLRRGDFFFTGSGTISHVVIYLGGGYLLQTYSASGGPVSVTMEDRWRGKFLSGRSPDLTVIDQFG